MKLLLSLFLATICVAAAAQNFSDTYKPGETLWVCSKEGVSLRAASNTSSKVITKLPYAAAVKVQADNNPRVKFVSTGVPGTWVLVSTELGPGYVFDGFFSRYKPMAPASPDGRYQNEIIDYLKSLFPVKKEERKELEGYNEYWHVSFVNGTEIKWEAPEGGSSFDINFPSSIMTFQETFLLARMAYPELFVKPCPFSDGNMTCETDDEMTSLRVLRDAAKGQCIISWGHAD